MKRLALTVLALLLAACGSALYTPASTVTTTQTRPKTVIGPGGTYWPVIDNDGTYVVGAGDVGMGKYRNAGGTMCHWARLRSPDPSDIIDGKQTSSPQEVWIRVSDTAFFTQNCGTWQFISPF